MLKINNNNVGDAVLAAQAILNNSISFHSILQSYRSAHIEL